MLPLIFASHLGLSGCFQSLCSLSCPSARSRGNLDRSTLRLPDFKELQSQKDASTSRDEGMREAFVNPQRNSYPALHAWNLVFLLLASCFPQAASTLSPKHLLPNTRLKGNACHCLLLSSCGLCRKMPWSVLHSQAELPLAIDLLGQVKAPPYS